ncbi:hypothetical protein O9Z70_05375 [Devosia sp. YIM 151766]|uniref:alpha/beta fold hydrolase n=1 Tax=Devosia sp. YIM 151766 TaxID=3017325 RepID=UPI00255C34A1|nr:hypothetical protein [Devosia sp. YIM 151766]WIY53962.1 hypothetical protein O9Z70_05375 [Devosia sp. YIM 151766]
MTDAVNDALHHLYQHERDAFDHWLEKDGANIETSCEIDGWRVPVLQYVKWKLASTSSSLRSDIQNMLLERGRGNQNDFILRGSTLFAFIDDRSGRSSGHIVILSPNVIAGCLKSCFPGAKITPALQRVVTCCIAGFSLGEIAKLDRKSNDTLKTQSRELRHQLELETTGDIGRIVSMRLAGVLGAALGTRNAPANDAFYRYVINYLPQEVRSLVLVDNNNQSHRILDMGPKTGTPVIVLHAIVPPDIRPQDIALLNELGLRLLWPLRNGLNAPDDPILSEAQQIEHACRGIELVHQVFCQGRTALLSYAASSKVALAYTEANPEHIEALFFAGACLLEGRPKHGARRLARGLLALASRNQTIMGAAMEYFRRKALTKERFPHFIRRQFRVSEADSAIVEEELSKRFAGQRFREALINSVSSARHDFGFQRALDWEKASGLNVEMHFLHGDNDEIHPLPLIEALVSKLPMAQLHKIEGAGQLLYYDHLRSVLSRIADRLVA